MCNQLNGNLLDMKRRTSLSVIVLSLSIAFSAFADVGLPTLISDGMVLQRDEQIKIWGWAEPGEEVTVRFRGKNYKTTTNDEGNWSVRLGKEKAGGPYSMTISGKNKIKIENILMGDVWLASGQSNMVHYMELHYDRYRKEIETVDNDAIRQFLVPENGVYTGPEEDLKEASWKSATRENIMKFSVVAYFFAKKLHEKYEVPIGIINSSIGGSPAEAWMSEEGLKDFDELLATALKNKDTAYVNSTNRKAAQVNRANYMNQDPDKGQSGDVKWYDEAYEPVNWKRINIPGYWEDQGIKNLDGVVWYRRTIDIPETMVDVPVKLYLGRIVDADNVYINGEFVGRTTYQYPQRIYEIPEGVLKAGENTIVVRVQNNYGKGGFVPDKPYYFASARDTVDIKGYWQYKVGQVAKRGEFARNINTRSQPVVYYNGMIAPFTDYALKGVIWYQGESNTGRPEQYDTLFPALIKDWRRVWGASDLPFIFVQLTNFMDVNYSPEESNWARLREAQRKTLEVSNTAMAVAIDAGEWNDIHPDAKKPVGDRLALGAMKVAYGENNVVYSGPVVKSATLKENQVVLEFEHVGSGLVSKDGEPLRWFAVAGEDKEFTWATAEIDGNKVILTTDIEDPKYVRYAWADNPDPVNFYNKEGLPASPFEVEVK